MKTTFARRTDKMPAPPKVSLGKQEHASTPNLAGYHKDLTLAAHLCPVCCQPVRGQAGETCVQS